ncbi:MAG: MATE family efflux transporter [Clostridia bacterium]|nr:MATE family efflux transporter [Clostridia bacterium]
MKNKRPENDTPGSSRALTGDVISLAWPTMLEQFMQTAVQYIDTFMVGSLGTLATAAVGCTTTVNWLLGSAISALAVGWLAYISQALGADDRKRAKKAAAQSVFITLIVGSVFTLLTLSLSGFIPVWMQADDNIKETASRYFFILYTPMLLRTAQIIFGTVLRAAGDTKTPMRVSVLVNIVNVSLNYLLIYPSREISVFSVKLTIPGAGMGVEGAAAASAAAFALGGILTVAAFLRHPVISPRGESLRPDPAVLRICLRIALPNMAQRFMTSLGYVVFASCINALGQTATAAHTVANTVESAFYVPGYGMQTAAATLTGNAIGAKDKNRIGALSKTLVLLEIGMMTVSGALLFAFAPSLVKLFSKDSEVIALGSTVLRMVALSEPFYGVSIVTEGMLQGAGKTSAPFVFNILCMWGIRIGGTLICTRVLGLGLEAAWACMIANNLALLACFRIYYRHSGIAQKQNKNK